MNRSAWSELSICTVIFRLRLPQFHFPFGKPVSFTMAVIVALTDFQPTLSVTVRLTVKVPGFWRVQLTMCPVASVSRSPLKSQAYPESRITPTFPVYAKSVDALPSKRTTVPSSTRSVRPFAMLLPVLFVLMFAVGSWSSTKRVMFRYVRFPLTSFTVRLTIDWPACVYVKFVRMPQVVVPGGANFHVKFADVMWPFGSVLSSALNINDVFPATYAW